MFIQRDMHSFSLGKELGYLGFHPLVLADTKFREREASFGTWTSESFLY